MFAWRLHKRESAAIGIMRLWELAKQESFTETWIPKSRGWPVSPRRWEWQLQIPLLAIYFSLKYLFLNRGQNMAPRRELNPGSSGIPAPPCSKHEVLVLRDVTLGIISAAIQAHLEWGTSLTGWLRRGAGIVSRRTTSKCVTIIGGRKAPRRHGWCQLRTLASLASQLWLIAAIWIF